MAVSSSFDVINSFFADRTLISSRSCCIRNRCYCSYCTLLITVLQTRTGDTQNQVKSNKKYVRLFVHSECVGFYCWPARISIFVVCFASCLPLVYPQQHRIEIASVYLGFLLAKMKSCPPVRPLPLPLAARLCPPPPKTKSLLTVGAHTACGGNR